MRAAVGLVAVVAVLSVGCGRSSGLSVGEGASESTGTATEPPPGASAIDGEVGYELLGVQPSAGEMGVVDHASDAERYDELWRRFRFEQQPPTVDFDEQVVLFYARAEDGCPDEVADVRLERDTLLVEWRPPAGGCIQPLIPTAFALAVHRATVPETFVAFLEGFHNDYDDVEHVVELTAYEGQGPTGVPARPDPPTPTRVTGTVELPGPGEAAARVLDDGTRVWVVHHRDGRVSVLAADASDDGDAESLSVRGLRTQVFWYPSARRFGGGGTYDEYGVSLRGRSGPNLDWYESAVDGSEVVVGERVGPVPYEHPSTDEQTPADGEPHSPDHPREASGLPLDEARQQPDGTVVILDAALVAYGDEPLRLCAAPEPPELWEWEGCPEDAATPVDVTLETNDHSLMWVWHGPLRVRVVESGFSEVTLLGAGHSGGRIDG